MSQVIALMGNKGAGKDTVAKYIKKYAKGFKKIYIMSFADSLKDATACIFGFDRKMLEGSTPASRAWREQPLMYLSNKMNTTVTSRWLLQHIGTDILRKHLYDGIWVDSVINKIIKLTVQEKNSLFVITDCRFRNEIKALQNLHLNNDIEPVTFVEVDRKSRYSEIYNEAVTFNTTKNPFKKLAAWLVLRKIHRSEWDWIGVVKDPIIIYNIGSLKNLENLTKTMVL